MDEKIYESGKCSTRGGPVEMVYHNDHAGLARVRFSFSRNGFFFYGDDVWEALGKELKGNPVAVWILGRRLEQSSLVSLSFVLRDGRGLRTKDDHQALKQQCKRLA